MGFNDFYGAFFSVPLHLGVTEADLKELDDDFSVIIKGNFECDENLLPEITAKVKSFCFGNKAICMDTLDEYVDVSVPLLG